MYDADIDRPVIMRLAILSKSAFTNRSRRGNACAGDCKSHEKCVNNNQRPPAANRRTLYGGEKLVQRNSTLFIIRQNRRFFNMNKNKDGYYRESFSFAGKRVNKLCKDATRFVAQGGGKETPS